MSKRLRLAKSQSKTHVDQQYFDYGSKQLSKTKRRSPCSMDKNCSTEQLAEKLFSTYLVYKQNA